MKTKTQTSLGLVMLALFAALALGVRVHAAWLTQLDAGASRIAAQALTPLNTQSFKLIGTLGSPAVVMAATCGLCLWLWWRHAVSLSLWIGGLQVFGAAIAEAIKQLIARMRPLHQLVPDSGYSFPSGHTFCTALFVFTLLWLGLPRLKRHTQQLIAIIGGIGWIALVAMSRVYLRDHYVSDVLASMSLASGYWLLLTPYALPLQNTLRRLVPERIQTLWLHKN
ncbi:phosphatase PAP2 family protein [Lacticaseibacillus baoqingensis]|uniref:Phosphatase PAP2 family protein n=1 Tax=Lacticaseibacillus baoqingensis TaxID=2486013 RepID=A0ABW4E315_9LACO|nr:phosphatase PAP2 family protein [Lacticaseibacillus baoqingensis]